MVEIKKYLLAVSSLLIGILLAELITRFYFISSNDVPGISDAEKCTRDFFERKDTFDPDDLLSLQVSYYEYSNTSGIKPRANFQEAKYQKANIPNYGTVLLQSTLTQINSQSILTYNNISKNKDKKRIAIFGDSFTFGADMPFHYSYPYLLEKLVPESEILNYGIEGVGVDTMYLRWKYESLELDPDITIFSIYIDDIARMRPCIYKPELVIQKNSIVEKNLPSPRTNDELIQAYKKPVLESQFIKHLVYTIKNVPGTKSESYSYGFELLPTVFDDVKSKSDLFMVVIIENGNDQEPSEFEKKQIQKLKNLLDSKNIPYITSNTVFEKENYKPHDYSNEQYVSHFMPEGNAYLAQGIKNKLEELGAVDESPDYTYTLDHSGSILVSWLTLQDKENPSTSKKIPVFRAFLQNGQQIDLTYSNLAIS